MWNSPILLVFLASLLSVNAFVLPRPRPYHVVVKATAQEQQIEAIERLQRMSNASFEQQLAILHEMKDNLHKMVENGQFRQPTGNGASAAPTFSSGTPQQQQQQQAPKKYMYQGPAKTAAASSGGAFALYGPPSGGASTMTPAAPSSPVASDINAMTAALAHQKPASSTTMQSKPFSVVTPLADMTFQLEEMEDKDTCTSELILNKDGTITLGETDGPLFSSATGSWTVQKGVFDMTITRTFHAGQKERSATDMGEFDFSVVRQFVGQVTTIGTKVAVEGTLHVDDDKYGDEEVGYFQMIDNREGDADPSGFKTSGSGMNQHFKVAS